MITVTAHRSLAGETQAAVRALAAQLEATVGAPPLNEHAWLGVGARGDGLTHLIAHRSATPDAVIGYGQLEHSGRRVSLGGPASVEVAGGPEVVDALLSAAEQRAPGGVQVWAHGRSSPVVDAVQARGYHRDRGLWQLRRTLADLPVAPMPAGTHIRTFVPGQDEDAWLAVNAAAFADHAEQGRWTTTDLAAREAETWFDPAGFLLAQRAGELIGYHWTKVHPDGAGEVYVLGVAPSAQGLGLGPALLTAGLRSLAGRGCHVVLLYVDETNDGARRLYERAGFLPYDLDVQYRSPSGSFTGS